MTNIAQSRSEIAHPRNATVLFTIVQLLGALSFAPCALAQAENDAAGLCNPADVCNDPDCSTAARCSAGCFGNPTCATQCGGSPCNVGCSLGVCGPGCPQECNPATCPQNLCTGQCGDPDCKVACGGSPCNAGCPNRCDPVQCPTNALCLPTCGGNECNAGCTPGVCGSGCPQECDPVLCPQNVIPCTWELLNRVSTRVDTAVNRTTDARDAAEEVRQGVRDGAAALTGQLRTAVEGALADLDRIVTDELAGEDFNAFTEGPNACSPASCKPFRQELMSLLLNIESGGNGIFVMTGLNQLQLDFQRMRDLIENLPGRVLFPLHRALQADNGDLLGALSNLLTELHADQDLIQDVFAAENRALSADRPGTPICTAMTETPLAFEIIVIRNTARAIALKVVAKILEALGETSASADAGVHGYAHITYKENFPKKFAAVLEALSQSEFYIAHAVNSKLEFCLTLQVEIDARQHQDNLANGQTQILDALRGNADLNYDGNIDLKDFAVFQQKFGSTGVTLPPPNPPAR